MWWWLFLIPLGAILIGSIWFAVRAWNSLRSDPLQPSAYAAMAGGVVISLLIGCGLMALAFYSSRHGYDDLNDGDRRNEK